MSPGPRPTASTASSCTRNSSSRKQYKDPRTGQRYICTCAGVVILCRLTGSSGTLTRTHTGFSLQPVTYIWPFHSTATILFVFIPHCCCIIYILYLPNSKLNKERIWKRHPTEADHANMYSAEVKTLRACNNGVSVVSLQAVNRQHGCLVVVLLQNGSFRLLVFRMTTRVVCARVWGCER